jgi:hypothetical protein
MQGAVHLFAPSEVGANLIETRSRVAVLRLIEAALDAPKLALAQVGQDAANGGAEENCEDCQQNMFHRDSFSGGWLLHGYIMR